MMFYAYVICQVHFILPNSILLLGYCQVDFINISLIHITELLIPHYQGHVPKQSQSSINNTTLPNCQVHFTLWIAQMSFKLPTN